QEFVLASASISAPRPPTTERVVALNRGPWVALPDPLAPVDDPGDAVVLDVRPVADFVSGHVPGAINVALDAGSFSTKAAFVLDPVEADKPVVTICESGARAAVAASLLAREGYDARALVDGGVHDFEGDTVSFRRCGS